MKIISTDIIVIGGGLTGLTLAYFLKQKNINAHIIEARDRLGGRIDTQYSEKTAPLEMGATWLGKQHTALLALLKELNIGVFEQVLGDKAIYEAISTSPPQLVTLPPNSEPSYRIQGGSSSLIHALAQQLNSTHIHTKHAVNTIEWMDNGIYIKTNARHFKAKKVISTLPPYLLTKTINIQPNLPNNLLNISKSTHTWMGESIKISLTYPKPFWRTPQSSGTMVSNVGPIPEMYDHSNHKDSLFALKGFLNGAYFSLKKEERLELVLKQLRKYYGTLADNFITYEEKVWRQEAYTFAPYASHILPHQNNGHAVYQESCWEDSFWVAGSETATQHPGYMEGAVRSARFVFDKILSTF